MGTNEKDEDDNRSNDDVLLTSLAETEPEVKVVPNPKKVRDDENEDEKKDENEITILNVVKRFLQQEYKSVCDDYKSVCHATNEVLVCLTQQLRLEKYRVPCNCFPSRAIVK